MPFEFIRISFSADLFTPSPTESLTHDQRGDLSNLFITDLTAPMSKESELQTGPHSEGRPRVLEGLLGKFSRRSKSQTSSAPSNNAQPKQKYGMFAFQPDSPECCIDIVAVHGLGGHFENTWTWNPADSPGEKPCNWLKDLLPSEFPNARILSFGYNSAVALSKSIADISMFGEMLLTRTLMERMKPWQRNRPIIFVGHSLGGIVIKKVFSSLFFQVSR